jgi:hypothetical protein
MPTASLLRDGKGEDSVHPPRLTAAQNRLPYTPGILAAAPEGPLNGTGQTRVSRPPSECQPGTRGHEGRCHTPPSEPRCAWQTSWSKLVAKAGVGPRGPGRRGILRCVGRAGPGVVLVGRILRPAQAEGCAKVKAAVRLAAVLHIATLRHAAVLWRGPAGQRRPCRRREREARERWRYLSPPCRSVTPTRHIHKGGNLERVFSRQSESPHGFSCL